MSWLTSRLAPDDARDDGFALILVIATVGIILSFVTIVGVVAIRSQHSSTQHTSFEQSLAVAEYGLNQGLSRVDATYAASPGADYTSPASGADCNAATVHWGDLSPATGTAASTNERLWAREWLLQIATKPGCLRSATKPAAQYVLMKPAGRQTVYAMSFVPSFAAANAQSRLLKAEYIFAPYKPSEAVLTNGDLTLDSSTTVTTASSGASSLAGVHSNGSISVQGNPSVGGLVSSTGTSTGTSNKFSANPGGAISTTPVELVPVVSALQVYLRDEPLYVTNASSTWYDLCADGKARAPSSGGPCQSGAMVLGDYSNGGLFNNSWSFQPAGSSSCPTAAPCWLAGKNMPDGVYFVNGADVAMASGLGNTSTSHATIIAAAQTEGQCPDVGGNIIWDHTNIATPALSGLFMLADADLQTGSNFSAGSDDGHGHVVSGAFIAGDQINMQTSSNGAFGSVIAGDQCKAAGTPVSANEIKNPSVYFDPGASAPISGVLDTTLWLEYTG